MATSYPWMSSGPSELDVATPAMQGAQLGLGIANARARNEAQSQAMDLAERRQKMQELLFPIEQQRAALGIQQLGAQIEGEKTKNDLQSLGLMQAQHRQQLEPLFAGAIASLDHVTDEDALNGNLPAAPQGLMADQQLQYNDAVAKRRQMALQNKRVQNTIQNQIDDEKHADELEANGASVRNEDGTINREALLAQQQALNTSKTLALAKRYNFDPTEGGITPETLFDRRGRLTPDGKELLDSLEKQRQQELQGNIYLEGDRIKAGAAAKNKSMTEAQGNALIYSERMGLNRDAINRLEQFNPATIAGTASRKVSQSELSNWLASEDGQVYTAAKRNWISAALRKESGAAISKSEYENADKEYFPQLGDGPKVIAHKNALRENYEKTMREAAGKQAQGMMTTQANTGNARITVISPDGKRGSIPSSQLQDALKSGYKRIDQGSGVGTPQPTPAVTPEASSTSPLGTTELQPGQKAEVFPLQ